MIDLSAIPLLTAEPQVQDFGGVLTPPLGGPVQRIDRVGTRWTITFDTPMLPAEPDLRLWSARLARAKTEGALVWIPEPGLAEIAYGSPRVAGAVMAGSAVTLSGLAPAVTIVEGKWLSFVHDGRRYLHRVVADVFASGSGTATISVNPMLRTSLAANDVVEFAVPKMQGTLTGSFGWTIPLDAAALSFTVAEDE